jgi:hypothetical protein
VDVAGINLPDLPDGITPLECVVTIKGLDTDGDITLYERISDGLTSWEALGMVTTLADSLRHGLADAHRDT